MKTMAVLLLILLISSVWFSSAVGRSNHLVTKHSLSSETDSPVYCDRDYSCLNCSSVRVCAPTSDGQHLQEIDRFTCPSYNPYCNYTTGSCSSSPDPSCYTNPNSTVSTNFTCMRDGYFPDPYNCSLYYECQDEVANQYTCTYPTPYYHPGYKYCVTDNYLYYCMNRSTTYYCSYTYYYGQKLPVYYTSDYFVYCGVKDKPIVVDKCIGAYYFDSSSQTCQFTCPNAGLFLKSDNCANYYKCSPTRVGGFAKTTMTCPEGEAFSESEFCCVDRSLVPNCNKPNPDMYSK